MEKRAIRSLAVFRAFLWLLPSAGMGVVVTSDARQARERGSDKARSASSNSRQTWHRSVPGAAGKLIAIKITPGRYSEPSTPLVQGIPFG
jgi:hypothetical protein